MAPTFVQSSKKKILLSNEGYLYHHHSFNKGGSRRYWRCERRATCNARCITNNVLPENAESLTIIKCDMTKHLHPPDPAKVVVRQVLNQIKEAARANPNAAPSTIIRENLHNVTNEEVLIQLPQKNTLKRAINAEQNVTRPAIPNTLNDVVIPHPYDKTNGNEQFVIFDNGPGSPERVIILSTKKNVKLFRHSDTIFSDGTFKSVPDQFLQLYTLHGVFMGVILPLVFMLCSHKTEQTYNTLYEQLKLYAASINVPLHFQHGVTDFELANMNALRRAFDGIQIHGCLFHFGQSLWRQLVNRGLREAYLNVEEPTVRHDLLELMALPFIPLEDVVDTFDELVEEIHEDVIDFAEYIERTYIRGTRARGRRRAVPPRFPPVVWNSYNLVMDDRQRTNNAVEGFHSKMNRVVGTFHANIWKFLEKLKDIQEETERNIVQRRGGHNISAPVNKTYTANQERVKRIVENYAEYKATGQVKKYLRAVAYHLKLHSNPQRPDDDEPHDE